jgi:hypothetical protein
VRSFLFFFPFVGAQLRTSPTILRKTVEMAQHILALSHVSLMRMYQLRSRENTHTELGGEKEKKKKKERKDLFHLFVCRGVVAAGKVSLDDGARVSPK